MGDRLVEYIKENKLEAFRRTMMSHERFDLDASSCLHWAILYARVEMVDILLTCGADVNRPGLYNNQTPLYVSTSVCGENGSELLKRLLNAGANPNMGTVKPILHVPETENMEPPPVDIIATPLIKLVDVGSKALAIVLINAGADVNLADADGYTPLTMAIERSNKDMVKMLLSFGANIEVFGPSGCSAFDMASESIRLTLTSHRAAGNKKTSHTKKKGWFGGLFKSNKNSRNNASEKGSADTRAVRRTVSSSSVSSGGSGGGSVSYSKDSPTTPAFNTKSSYATTPTQSPQKVILCSSTNDMLDNATPNKMSTTSVNQCDYVAVTDPTQQIVDLEKRVAVLEKKLEAQASVMEEQARQIAILMEADRRRL